MKTPNGLSCINVQRLAAAEKEVGRGAWGIVKTWGKSRVVKIESCARGYRDKGFLKDGLTEDEILAPIVAAGMTPKVENRLKCGKKCLTIMQRIEGPQAAALVKQGTTLLPTVELCCIETERMHRMLPRGLGHGDLHDENILIQKERPIFIDWALARKLGQEYDWAFLFESFAADMREAGLRAYEPEVMELLKKYVPEQWQNQAVLAFKKALKE